MADPEYYYNTETGEVEEGRQSSWMDLMGPYATREEAAAALDKAKARNEAADAEQKAWDDWNRDDEDEDTGE